MLFQIEHHSRDAAVRLRLRHSALVHGVGELRQIAADLTGEEAPGSGMSDRSARPRRAG